MPKIFVAWENPPSMFGIKRDNYYPGGDKEGFQNWRKEEKKSLAISPSGGKSEKLGPLERKGLVKGISEKLWDDVVNDQCRLEESEVIREFLRSRGDATGGSAGSLSTMFSMMRWAGLNARTKFDTLILCGHANGESLSLGFGKNSASTEGGNYSKLEGDRRQITVDPEYGRWQLSFDEIAPYAEADNNKLFHVFLVGCETGRDQSTASDDDTKMCLARYLSSVLPGRLKQPVAVYGFVEKIDGRHTRELLFNLDKYKMDRSFTGEQYIDLIEVKGAEPASLYAWGGK